MAGDLSGLELLVIQIDGIHMDEDMTLVAAIDVRVNGDKLRLGWSRAPQKTQRPSRR
jgi:putative transposase